jgi:OOP family OmpA-OmpF porin
LESPSPQPDPAQRSEAEEFQQLRDLLLGEEFQQLLRLREQVESDEAFSDRVAEVLALAIERRSRRDSAIADALAPTIDDALSGSVANDPGRLANSIYPIMGPAIRKSISEAISDLLEDFNRVLTLGFSRQALGWRFEAWRTGRSYAEVALLKSLEYRVEQLFLVQRDTGLLMQHVQADDHQVQDPDMVSGMLSAIQSFIEDSFSVQGGQTLDTMSLGDLTVLVRQGPVATLAAVVRGPVPSGLRNELEAALERMHGRPDRALQAFDGDPEALQLLQPELEALLWSKKKEPRQGTPWFALLVIALALVAAGYWWYQAWQRSEALAGMAMQLDAEPGIVWLSTDDDRQAAVFKLLVDPDARAPDRVLAESPLGVEHYRLVSRAQLSADPEIVMRRAERILAPPAGVMFAWNGPSLVVTGEADNLWAERLNNRWSAVPGLQAMDASGLALRFPQREALQALVSEVENTRLEFDVASTEIGAYTALIPELAVKIRELDRLYQAEGRGRPRIDIVGYTDESGTRDINHRIGTQRADTVHAALLAAGIDPRLLNATDSLDYHNVSVSRERQVRLFVQQN